MYFLFPQPPLFSHILQEELAELKAKYRAVVPEADYVAASKECAQLRTELDIALAELRELRTKNTTLSRENHLLTVERDLLKK